MQKSLFFMVCVTVASILFSLNSQAQKGFYVSAQAAPWVSVKFNESDVHNPGTNYKSKTSGTIGIGGGYNFTNNLGIGAEFMYSKERQTTENTALSYDESLNFIKIPVIFTYNTNPFSKVMFAVKAGPQLGLLVSSEVSNSSYESLNGDTKDNYVTASLGVMLGTSARVRLTDKLCADAGLRFDGAFTNLESKNYRNNHPGRGTTHSINAGIEIGIRYSLN